MLTLCSAIAKMQGPKAQPRLTDYVNVVEENGHRYTDTEREDKAFQASIAK